MFYCMILISKNERDYFAKQMPGVHVRRTMKKKSDRHKYYIEESDAVMRALKELRLNDR